MTKLLISGGRHFKDWQLFKTEVLAHTMLKGAITIIHGYCISGADAMAENLADKMAWRVKRFPAKWNKHGKSAGPIRNNEMAIECDEAIVFWDGKSKGTKNMIDCLKKYNKPYKLIRY